MIAGFPKVIFQAVKIPALLAGDAKLNPSLMNILSQPKKWSSVEGYPPDRVQSCQTSRLMVSLGPLSCLVRHFVQIVMCTTNKATDLRLNRN